MQDIVGTLNTDWYYDGWQIVSDKVNRLFGR